MKKASRQRSLFAEDSDPSPPQGEQPKPSPPCEEPPEPQFVSEGTAPPETLEGKSVYVIDSHSLIYQVFHALPEMTSPHGEPVGAVYGFARDLLYLLEERRPDYLFCAFDMKGPTFRHALYEPYKANRAAMPDELASQILKIRRLIQAMGIPAVGLESYEADDILATVADLTERLGGDCYLVTGDKDSRQLLSDRVRIFNIRKQEIYDRDALREDWGIAPEQVVDFQALVGDTSDNVPGVALFGPKLARQLLETYGTLEDVLDHAEEVSGKKRKQNLIEGREIALLSRELVRLKRDTPVALDWQAGQVGPLEAEPVLTLFRDFGFRSIGEKVEQLSEASPAPQPEVKVEYHLVDTPEALASFVTELKQQKRISLDTETTSVYPRHAEIVGYSFAWREDEAWYLPVRGPQGDRCLDPAATLEALRPVIEDPAVEKIGQNLKYDMIVLRSAGVRMAGLAFDTMVASYLLDAGARNHNMDDLAKRYLNHQTISITELIGKGKNQKRMDEVSTRLVADYAGEDAVIPLRLWPILSGRLEDEGLAQLWADLERPVVEVLAEMEFNGIAVDTERLAELSSDYGQRLEQLEKEIHELAGRPFNIASPKQLREILFEELELPVLKKTKTGPSTDAEVLEQLADQHALPAKILEHRQIAKLKGTYLDAIPEMVHPETHRVHASFNQVVAATGRLSSSDPNLQNIPVRTSEGRAIRSAFVPGGGDQVLMAADYSQIELRVLAHFSLDERLCEAFEQDEDIHAQVAGRIHGVPQAEVTSDMRRQAKAVNFGVIYGQSAFGLAKQLGITPEEAAQFIDAYFAEYPRIETLLDEILADCRKNGYVGTIAGRRRAILGVRPETSRQKNLAERTAINTVIQGSAADIIKEAMVRVQARLARDRVAARLLLQIHDELVFEVDRAAQDELAALVVEEMSGAMDLAVPLKVDLKVGPNWAETEAVA